MKIEIKSFDQDVLFSCESESLKLALEEAVSSSVNLRGADLCGADLSGGVNLHGAHLREANLNWANLSQADLRQADLREAHLRETNLNWANLSQADLRGAHLRETNLNWANLSQADLRSADLRDVTLHGANLGGIDLRWAKNTAYIVLETGETLADFRDKVVPELIKAGGHPVSAKAWSCHSWDGCPMAKAFQVHNIEDIPALNRERANQFIRLFDAGLIKKPWFRMRTIRRPLS